MNALTCGIRMWAQVSFVLLQFTHLTIWFVAKTALHKCSTVKNN